MKKELLSEKALNLLLEAGWSEERHIDFSKEKEQLEKFGWVFNEYILEVIENINGIFIKYGDIEFDVMEGTYDESEFAKDLKTTIKENVVYIGMTYFDFIFLGESKNVYVSDCEQNIYLIANGIENGINEIIKKGPDVAGRSATSSIYKYVGKLDG